MRKQTLIYFSILVILLISGCDEAPNQERQANEASKNEVELSFKQEINSGEKVNYLIEPQYDQVSRSFIDGLMEVEINIGNGKRKGFINDQGKVIIKPQYEETKFYIGMGSASSGFAEDLAPVKKDGKWGYINLQGETAINFSYDDARLFTGNRAVVMVDEKYGLINPQGEWIVSPVYDQIYMKNGVGMVERDNKSGFIDANGNVLVEPTYDYVDLNDKYGIWNPFVYVYKDDLVGVVRLEESTLSTIILPKYSKIFPFHDGLAQFVTMHKDEYGNFQGDVSLGYLDETGKEAVKWEHFPYEFGSLSEGKIAIQNDTGEWGYVDMEKNVLIPHRYDEANPFYDDMAIVIIDGKQGVIDPSGSWILEPDYIDIIPLDSYFIVHDDRGKYLISTDDRTKISNVYDDIGRGSNIRPVKLNDKVGFINENGEEVIPLNYDECYTFAFWEEYAAVRKQGEWFYINAQGQRLGETTFDEIGLFDDGYAKVKKGGKWGVVDRNQEIVVPMQFEEVSVYREGLVLVKKNKKYGFVQVE